ncbi:MAG TPA: hypothetical protein VJC05_00625 [Candidatus Andersenbacteria bacterium]|nr:hypothetical protein [Candidatus Andersenbacteria bacterium]
MSYALHAPVEPTEEYRNRLIFQALPAQKMGLQRSMVVLFERLLTPDMLLHDQIGNPIEHHTVVLSNIVEIAMAEFGYEADELLFFYACLALLHDNCPTPKIPREVIDAAIGDEKKRQLAATRIRNREIHMRDGAQRAGNILEELRQDRTLRFAAMLTNGDVDTICRVIAIHDNPTIGIPLPDDFKAAHILREADRLWMVTNLGIRVDLSRRGVDPDNPDAFLEQAQRNTGKFMGERQYVYPTVQPGVFQDSRTFFRTTAGYNLYCRYWAEIGQYGAERRGYIRND